MDPQIAALLDLMNPRNTLTSYIYLVIIAAIFRLFLIIIPLWKAYVKFSKRGVIPRLLKVRKLASIDGIFGFLCMEFFLVLLPLSVASIFRLIFGTPSELQWSIWQLCLALFFGMLWLLVDLNRTLSVNRSLKPLQKWYTHSFPMIATLEGIMWGRNTLQSLSEFDKEAFDIELEEQKNDPKVITEYVPVDPDSPLIRDEDGKITGIDSDVLVSKAEDVKTNIGIFVTKTTLKAKEKWGESRDSLKKPAEKKAKQIDAKLQEKVENITNRPGRLKDLLSDITMSAYPLVLIYYLLPLLG